MAVPEKVTIHIHILKLGRVEVLEEEGCMTTLSDLTFTDIHFDFPMTDMKEDARRIADGRY